jgi:hypothetical protein
MGVGGEVAEVTSRAMDGSMNLEAALEERLRIIDCTPKDIKAFIKVGAVWRGFGGRCARERALGERLRIIDCTPKDSQLQRKGHLGGVGEGRVWYSEGGPPQHSITFAHH